MLDALVKAARKGGDVAGAVTAVAALDTIEADAALIRQTTRQSRPDVLRELVPEHRVFKQTGPRFLASFTFEGGRVSAPLLAAIGVLRGLGGDRRRALPANLPLGHVEGRWRPTQAWGRMGSGHSAGRPLNHHWLLNVDL